MSIDRKTFISSLALGSGGVLFGRPAKQERNETGFPIPDDFSIIYLATRWGFPGSLEEFCTEVKEAGYDGIEVWLPDSRQEQERLMKTTRNYQLEVGLLVGSGRNSFANHLTEFKRDIDQAVELNPLLINCHSGRDYFSFEQNRQIIDYAVKMSKSTGIDIYHETHRSRILFAAHIARRFIEQIPDLCLTLDISHWCNVHESMLADQPEAVQRALERTGHIHARVGHREGPQVTDPRAPEWEQAVVAHFDWWDQVVKRKIEDGARLTVTPEFGPPAYMPAVPYTKQPLANQWEINAYMMELWKQRYS